MSLKRQYRIWAIIAATANLLVGYSVFGQVSQWQETRRGSFYFSAGMYSFINSKADIHISQDELNTNYTIYNAKTGISASSTSSVAANFLYNIGYFFNYNQTWALELSYNPFSYYITDNQKLREKGSKTGQSIDSNVLFNSSGSNFYNYGKGSSLVLINIVRRYPVYRNKIRNFSVDAYGKTGIGPTLLYADNKLDNVNNSPKLSAATSWNIDAAVGGRVTGFRYLFGEFFLKYNRIGVTNAAVYKGSAAQIISFISVNINAGISFPATKRNPMFRKGERKKKGLPTGPEPRGDINPEKAPIDQVIENY